MKELNLEVTSIILQTLVWNQQHHTDFQVIQASSADPWLQTA